MHQAGKPNSLPSDMVRAVLIKSNDELWIGTREGLSILKHGGLVNYAYDKYDPDGLTFNSVRHLMKDNAGNIWIGTYAGGVNVFYAESRNFINISEGLGQKPGLSERMISSIVRNDDGSFWLGTEGGGLNFVDPEKNIYRHYNLNSPTTISGNNTVKSISKDALRNLWVGAYTGLYYFDVNKHRFTTYKAFNLDTTSAGKQIYAIETSDNAVLLGTNGAGLQIMDKAGNVVKYLNNPKNPNSLSCNNINSILYDAGNYWIGTPRGLNLFDTREKTFTRFKHVENQKFTISRNAVLSLFKDRNHHLWIGTQGGGLNYYDRIAHKFFTINEKTGLANGVIHAINQDKQGDLWVSTNKGLSKIHFAAFSTPFRSNTVKITNYSIADGLATNQFSTGATSVSGGKIVFGSISGITLFDPAHIGVNSFKPPVVITDLLIRNKPVILGDAGSALQSQINEITDITLKHDEGFITFKFAALNFIESGNNRYAHKLDGFKGDNDWHYVDNQRLASYTNLDAGTYTFSVKAANNDGVWNSAVKSIKIVVLPPWWETWWAYSMYLLIIGSVFYLINAHSIKTERLTNELRFEHLSREKDQQLAQRKIIFFTNISHEIKTPLTLILIPLEEIIKTSEGNDRVQNQLRLMQRNGDRLIKLINQLLDFRKFDAGNMKLHAAPGNVVPFVHEIVLSFQGYAASKNLTLLFDAEQPEIGVFYDHDKLEKICYNLISNALKFTVAGGLVAVKVGTDATSLFIKVIDNGIGIPTENIDKIFDCFSEASYNRLNAGGTGIGLSFSKGMAELHHGSISVVSHTANDSGRGYTCFTVTLPLGCAHLRENEIVHNMPADESIEQYILPALHNHQANDEHNVLLSDEAKPIMLIIEDNADLLNFIASNFITAYHVHTAKDGMQGWELATELIPDIIISDVMMPDMDGITLCSNIKTDGRTSHIPVILLTARTPLIFKLEGLETGADDYITKPFSMDVLETRVRNLIESRKLLRERYSKEINLQPQNIAITSTDERFLTKIMTYIEAHISDSNLSVEEVGKAVGMSRAPLSQGKKPHQSNRFRTHTRFAH